MKADTQFLLIQSKYPLNAFLLSVKNLGLGTIFAMLAIITVVYRNYEILHDFIESLSKQSSQFYTVYFIDVTENEKREILPWIRKIDGKYSFIETKNMGYAQGVNVGIEQALRDGKTKFAVVNPDIIFDSDFVQNASESISRNPKSIIGGKIYYARGFEYHKDKYQPTDLGNVIWYAGGRIDWNHALGEHIGVDEVDSPKFSKFGPTEFVSGCLMIYDKSVHDIVGNWDTSYFLYFEDTDYCVRASTKNISIIYDPNIIIYHKNAQSTGGSGSNNHEVWMKKSRFRFGMKYAPIRTKMHLILNYALSKKP